MRDMCQRGAQNGSEMGWGIKVSKVCLDLSQKSTPYKALIRWRAFNEVRVNMGLLLCRRPTTTRLHMHSDYYLR